jgi:hypothetical protein
VTVSGGIIVTPGFDDPASSGNLSRVACIQFMSLWKNVWCTSRQRDGKEKEMMKILNAPVVVLVALWCTAVFLVPVVVG